MRRQVALSGQGGRPRPGLRCARRRQPGMTALMTRVMATLSPRLMRAAGYPVGLHLGADRLSAAQMQRTASGLALSAVASLDLGCPWYAMLGEPRRFKLALQRLWTEHGFRGSEVIAAMPPEQLKVF